jgi:uncharacterized protein
MPYNARNSDALGIAIRGLDQRTSMSLQEQLMVDLQQAMRAADVPRREAIRMLRAAILNEEIEAQRPLDDGEAIRVIDRLVKRHRDSIELFEKGGRPDLVAHEQAQLAVIQAYLPERIGLADLEAQVRAAILQTGARGRSDSGKVMQLLAAQLRGKADLSEVNRIVREQLSA